MIFNYFVAFILFIWYQSSFIKSAKHVRFTLKISKISKTQYQIIMLENIMFLNSNFIKNFRNIVNDFHYYLDNFKIRENIFKKASNILSKKSMIYSTFFRSTIHWCKLLLCFWNKSKKYNSLLYLRYLYWWLKSYQWRVRRSFTNIVWLFIIKRTSRRVSNKKISSFT